MKDLYSIKVVENKLEITSSHPFSITVSIHFTDEDFATYLNNFDKFIFTDIYIPHNMKGVSIRPSVFSYVIFWGDITSFNDFLSKRKFKVTYKKAEHFNLEEFREVITKKITKFLSPYERRFSEIKSLSENYKPNRIKNV